MTARKVTTHQLDLKKTLPYFLDHIRCGKTLSAKVAEKIDFAKGSFFTILPCNALLDKLFMFNEGGIIPSVPYGEKSYLIKDQPERFHPKTILTMDRECSEFISQFLCKSYNNLSVIENYILNPESPYVEIENVKTVIFNSEVYYVLNSDNSVNEVYKTIRKSSQVWHFLAVLTHLQHAIPTVLTNLKMDQICENAKFVIAGAYDGEGYIFWHCPNSLSIPTASEVP